jgi:midasin (ATPase involved in ribosome maturation)
VKLFARILGKKLHIFELNKDFQISFLTKNFIYKQFEKEEINNINNKYKKILKKKNDEINDAYYLEKKYRDILKIKNIDEESKKTLKEIKKNYNYIRRFEYCESEFLEALKNGEWILLDGIENSPTFIAEKLSFLCGEKPELNLYEKNIEPIYPSSGFRLFITYNSERTINYNLLPNSLLDKCLIYNLKSFSQDLISISQIIYGHLVNLHFCTDKNILFEISSKLSKIHGIIKDKLILNNKDNITERTVINYCGNLNS